MLGDFMVKNATFEREIYIKLKIDKVETKCDVLQIIIIICVARVQKNFLSSSFNYAVIDKISNFHDIAPNFTFSQIS